jgi:hypothetical protein
MDDLPIETIASVNLASPIALSILWERWPSRERSLATVAPYWATTRNGPLASGMISPGRLVFTNVVRIHLADNRLLGQVIRRAFMRSNPRNAAQLRVNECFGPECVI